MSRLGQELLAQSSILIAAVSYGAAGVYGRRFGRLGIPPLVAATGQLTASALVLLPIALIVDTPWSITAVSANGWLALLGLGFISTALAYLLYFKILATAGATNVLLVTLLIPVTTTILGTSFLGEVLKSNHFIGMCFISIGLLVVDGRSGRVLVSKVKRIRVRIQNMIEAS